MISYSNLILILQIVFLSLNVRPLNVCPTVDLKLWPWKQTLFGLLFGLEVERPGSWKTWSERLKCIRFSLGDSVPKGLFSRTTSFLIVLRAYSEHTLNVLCYYFMALFDPLASSLFALPLLHKPSVGLLASESFLLGLLFCSSLTRHL